MRFVPTHPGDLESVAAAAIGENRGVKGVSLSVAGASEGREITVTVESAGEGGDLALECPEVVVISLGCVTLTLECSGMDALALKK